MPDRLKTFGPNTVRFAIAARIAVAVAAFAPLSGCVGYTTYPAASWQIASDEMNGPPADEIMIEAVKWAVDRYETGATGSVVINLPDVVRDRTYGIIALRAGERVIPMEPGMEDLPTYHLTRLWVRGDKAEVDLLRPVNELGASPSGAPIVQAVTVYLRGGLRSWYVERARHWKIGTDAVPALHYYGQGDERAGPSTGAPAGETPAEPTPTNDDAPDPIIDIEG